MIQRDLSAVLAIEAASHPFPWTEDEFHRVLRLRNSIGLVAEAGDTIVGFVVYSLNKSSLAVLDFAVHPGYRLRGVGRRIVDKLVGKLSFARRTTIKYTVRESNLDGQLFLKAMGFRAFSIIPGMYREDTGEDGYWMEYQLEGTES